MSKVLLVSMPFALARLASPGLSVLKTSCQDHGLECRVEYLNLKFRQASHAPESYDQIAEHWLLGEWVFGRELFGPSWSEEGQGSAQYLAGLLGDRLDARQYPDLLHHLVRLREQADPFLEHCLDSVNWKDYNVIGFTSGPNQQVPSLALARRLKERWPERVIAFGGPNCQGEMASALASRFPFVDWFFSGEAELSFPQAVERRAAGKSLNGIPGLVQSKQEAPGYQGLARVDNLDSTPYPDFSDHFDAVSRWAPELLGSVPLYLQYSRGCWWGMKSHCIFCGINGQAMSYRCKSPERAVQETTWATFRYQVSDILVSDTIMAPHYFQTVLPRLAQLDLSAFFVETRPDLTRQQLHRLKQVGSISFQPGIESLDTDMLRRMGKGASLLDNLQCLKWARALGLSPLWNFLHSFPGETLPAYRRMEALIPRLVHLRPPRKAVPIVLHRDSPLFRHPEQWNLGDVHPHPFYSCIYPFESTVRGSLAYFFECASLDSPGHLARDEFGETQVQTEFLSVLERVLGRLKDWQNLWNKPEPPLLALSREAKDAPAVYDTRPGSPRFRTEISRRQYRILEICDQGRSPEFIARALTWQYREAPVDQGSVHGELSHLVDLGYMVQDGDQYLALANELETLAQYGRSTIASLLVE